MKDKNGKMNKDAAESKKLSLIEQELKIPKSKIITVSQLNDYIAQKLTTDSKLLNIYLIGEVSNLKSYCIRLSFNYIFQVTICII